MRKSTTYDGNVTLVIKSGSNLPLIKARKPKGFVSLLAAGQEHRTEEAMLASPDWNYICQFQAKPGEKLVFKVFQSRVRKIS